MKLSRKERTKAFQQYARRHGYYVRTVRNMTCLKQEAIKEYINVLATNPRR